MWINRLGAAACAAGVWLATTVGAHAQTVTGIIDGVPRDASGLYQINGWTCALGWTTPIEAHVYVGGPAGIGTGLGAYAADRWSESGIASACQSYGSAYRFAIQPSVAQHQQFAGAPIYVYGVTPGGGASGLLARSGDFALPAAPYVLGRIDEQIRDASGTYQLRGWACSTGNKSSISVDLYAGGAGGAGGTGIARFVANQSSEPTIASSCESSGTAYRFLIPLTTAMRQAHAGKALHLHGISPVGGPNLQLSRSGEFKMPAAPTVVGMVDELVKDASGYFVRGWTCLTSSASPIYVDLYVGGRNGGTGLGRFNANLSSESVIGTSCESNGMAYRFKIPLTPAMREAHAGKSLYLYGISPVSGPNAMLARSGELKMPAGPSILGSIDEIQDSGGSYQVRGWACSVGTQASINVHFYAGGGAGVGALVGGYSANQASEAPVNALCEAGGTAYRFVIPLTTAIRQTYANKPIFVHGISPVGGSNLLIANSGTFKVPSPYTVMRRYVYNQYQELCKVLEPETGATVMTYDAAGNLATSASGLSLPSTTSCDTGDASVAARRISRTYDARNRIKTLRFPDGRGNADYSYTPDGLLASVTVENGGGQTVTTAYAYNRRRLPTSESQALVGRSMQSVGYGYDGNGALRTVVYPDGQTLDYAPNALGQATQASGYAAGVSYYPNGAIKQFTYGNGIVHSLTQNARQLPDRSLDQYGGTAVLDDSYDYDGTGNVLAISDGLPGNRGNRDMVYDGLDRLVSAASPMFGTANDNLTRVKVSGGNAVRDHYYCYDPAWRLTNIKTGSCSGSTVTGLGYDAQGNLNNKNGVTYAFDYGNRLRSVSSPASSYAYDGHGRRVVDTTAGVSRYSLYSQSGQLLYTQDQRAARNSQYVYLGHSLLAVREVPSAGGAASIKYQHTDALGTPVAVTDSSRKVVERTESEPYGKPANRNVRDGAGYTGHVEDAATGLSYMQQRYYDPQVGRFLSVDAVSAYGGGQRHFNRYDYAYDNPYKFTDPDGRLPILGPVIFFFVGAVLHSEPANAPSPGEKTEGGSAGDAFDAVPGGGPVVRGARMMAEGQKTYTTYTREKAGGAAPYSGRTSGTGTPEQQVAARTAKPDHQAKTAEGYGPARVDKSSSNADAIRGREDQLIRRNGGAQSQGGTSGNKINGISEANPKAEQYRSACQNEFGC